MIAHNSYISSADIHTHTQAVIPAPSNAGSNKLLLYVNESITYRQVLNQIGVDDAFIINCINWRGLRWEANVNWWCASMRQWIKVDARNRCIVWRGERRPQAVSANSRCRSMSVRLDKCYNLAEFFLLTISLTQCCRRRFHKRMSFREKLRCSSWYILSR